jgi:SAM-dependent methyltransferase
MGDATYVLGHSQAEVGRLIHQATILQTITERLLRSVGITRGMRVLDVGCGAGDVAMLAGELVGASGSVVGIDQNAQVLAVARERAEAGGLLHVAFTEASIDTFADPAPFDLVIARAARQSGWHGHLIQIVAAPLPPPSLEFARLRSPTWRMLNPSSTPSAGALDPEFCGPHRLLRGTCHW